MPATPLDAGGVDVVAVTSVVVDVGVFVVDWLVLVVVPVVDDWFVLDGVLVVGGGVVVVSFGVVVSVVVTTVVVGSVVVVGVVVVDSPHRRELPKPLSLPPLPSP